MKLHLDKTREATVFACMFMLLLGLFSYASPLGAHELSLGAHELSLGTHELSLGTHELSLGTHEEGEHSASITVDDVDVTDKDSVRNFLLHSRSHYDQITVYPKWSEFRGLV